MRYIEELEDWSNYVIPEPPAPSTVTPNLLSVELDELPMDGELEGYMGRTTRRASSLTLDGKFVVYALKKNPVFVAAHPCLEGPHMVHTPTTA